MGTRGQVKGAGSTGVRGAMQLAAIFGSRGIFEHLVQGIGYYSWLLALKRAVIKILLFSEGYYCLYRTLNDASNAWRERVGIFREFLRETGGNGIFGRHELGHRKLLKEGDGASLVNICLLLAASGSLRTK